MRVRTGTTMVEQLAVLVVIGVLAAIVVRSVAGALDALAVRAAAREIKDVFAAAREYAVARGVRTAVQVEPFAARVTALSGTDTVLVRPLGLLHQVALTTSRDSMAYSPSGLGYGASNLRVIVWRHRSAETVTVSRLGRVR